MADWRAWDEDEDDILLEWANRITWIKISKLIPGRSPDACRRRLDVLAAHKIRAHNSHVMRVAQDEAFQLAMRLAIKAGLERATIGIIKTPEDDEFRPTKFLPGLHSSGCSSAAAACAEVA